jgi:ribonuclease VapC
MKVVLDASAVLAYLQDEPGKDHVSAVLNGAKIGCVNAAEVFSKLADTGLGEAAVSELLKWANIELVSFDADQAWKSGALRPLTRHRGLSLGGRVCLVLAMVQKAVVITADRTWLDLGLDVEIRCIR